MSADGIVSGNRPFTRFKLPGDPSDPRPVAINLVSRDHFNTFGLPLVEGRDFEDDEDPADRRIIINETLRNELWGGESAIDKVLLLQGDLREEARAHRIIGVVRQPNCTDHLRGVESCIYQPFPGGRGRQVLALRSAGYTGLLAAVHGAVESIDAGVLVYDGITIEHHLADRVAGQRVFAFATSGLGLLGVLLAAVGGAAVFGAHVRNDRESLSLRMALGASPGRLMRPVIFRAGLIGATGTSAGILLSMSIWPVLAGELYGVEGVRSEVILSVFVLMLGGAMAASCWPARAIATTDPAEVLRGR